MNYLFKLQIIMTERFLAYHSLTSRWRRLIQKRGETGSCRECQMQFVLLMLNWIKFLMACTIILLYLISFSPCCIWPAFPIFKLCSRVAFLLNSSNSVWQVRKSKRSAESLFNTVNTFHPPIQQKHQ